MGLRFRRTLVRGSALASATLAALALLAGCAPNRADGRGATEQPARTSPAPHAPLTGLNGEPPADCPVTALTRAAAPRDPNADPIPEANWYMNAAGTIWAGAVPEDGWRAGGEKTYWVRPQGTDLSVEGHLVGDRAVSLRASIPCCYPTGFQVVGLEFPEAGCWQVTATAGSETLTFVSAVGPPGQGP